MHSIAFNIYISYVKSVFMTEVLFAQTNDSETDKNQLTLIFEIDVGSFNPLNAQSITIQHHAKLTMFN